MTHLSRRRALALAAASALPVPALARTAPDWAGVSARARALPQARALIVQVDGTRALAEAYRGPPLSRPAPIKSVSKTIVAALLGAAIDRGEIPSVSATLGELAPGLIPKTADPRAAEITVEDLVTLRAGLERTSGANYGPWVASRDWVADALSRPFVAEPGGRMLYSTGSTHVLGAVLAHVAGRSLLDLARERLGRPLGVEIPAWTRDPQGRYLGGNEMALTPDAMIRFGELYRNGGRAEGAGAALSADWVAASFEPRTRSPWSGLDYGYGWFLGRMDGEPFALARGYGGQIICILPGVTLALTSDPTQRARSGGYFSEIMTLISDAILPAARAMRD